MSLTLDLFGDFIVSYGKVRWNIIYIILTYQFIIWYWLHWLLTEALFLLINQLSLDLLYRFIFIDAVSLLTIMSFLGIFLEFLGQGQLANLWLYAKKLCHENLLWPSITKSDFYNNVLTNLPVDFLDHLLRSLFSICQSGRIWDLSFPRQLGV